MRTIYGFLVAVFVSLLVIAAPVNVKALSLDCQQLIGALNADIVTLGIFQDLNAAAVADYNAYNGNNPAVLAMLESQVWQSANAVTNQLTAVDSDLEALHAAHCM